MAKGCIGTEKTYKEVIPMDEAYSRLKFIVEKVNEEEVNPDSIQ